MSSVQHTLRVSRAGSESITFIKQFGVLKMYDVREASGVTTRWIGPVYGIGPIFMQWGSEGELIKVTEPARFGTQFGTDWLTTFYASDV